MIFRVYLRDPSQRVSEKTNTGDAGAAIAAFSELVSRTDLDGSRMLAVITKNGSPVAYHHFNSSPEDENRYWRGRIEQLPIYYCDAGRPAELEGGKRVNVYLDAESLSIAAEIGDGNVSEGIRSALKIAAARDI